MNPYIELKILEVSQSVSLPAVYILILQNTAGYHKLPIMIAREEALQIKLRLKGDPKLERPMLPDLLKRTISAFDITLNHVLIYAVKDGVYYAQLYCQHNDEIRVVESRTSDAVVLALTFDCPIYITSELLEQQYMREQKDGMVSLPINAIQMSVLEEALKSAIAHEDYELASQLRDEIKRRK